MTDNTSKEQNRPEVIPWERFQKEAERGLPVDVYITSMNAHILNQRDEINRLRERLAAALSFVPDDVKLSELRNARETTGEVVARGGDRVYVRLDNGEHCAGELVAVNVSTQKTLVPTGDQS